ncbi:MAG: ADP-glyceromanno-heptose 6-epimerase [Bdellovibrionaceae bacterium]|nr:ADP-glyceromanno-heptose 6-epimerase [Pseudobdellovibrionaceae bacterium]MDW8189926.1 ADP-glyceromanno-heptose 6-epimerase [Pseudobdellovibrionaceae bacterium]
MVVITGGTGFIGSQLCGYLNQLGIEDVILVDKVSPQQRPLNCQQLRYRGFYSADQFLSEIMANGFQQNAQSIRVVFHLGANSSTTESNWSLLEQDNVFYSRAVWHFCVERKIPLIYASSAATYGDGSLGYDDHIPPQQLRPLNLYGESKRVFDEFVLQQQKTPPYFYGIKFFNVYGPGEFYKGDMASLVFKAFHQIRSTGYLRLFKSYRPEYGHGEQKRDFVYIKDVTRWLWELFQKKPPSGIYNMGFGTARTWNDLARAIFMALERPIHIEYIEMPPYIRERYQYFTEAPMAHWFQQGLSSPHYSLEDGVSDYIRILAKTYN